MRSVNSPHPCDSCETLWKVSAAGEHNSDTIVRVLQKKKKNTQSFTTQLLFRQGKLHKWISYEVGIAHCSLYIKFPASNIQLLPKKDSSRSFWESPWPLMTSSTSCRVSCIVLLNTRLSRWPHTHTHPHEQLSQRWPMNFCDPWVRHQGSSDLWSLCPHNKWRWRMCQGQRRELPAYIKQIKASVANGSSFISTSVVLCFCAEAAEWKVNHWLLKVGTSAHGLLHVRI